MTPEEKAVIKAAERWARAASPADAEDRSDALQDAVADLLRARDCQCSRMERVYCQAENCHGGADVAEWLPATFALCLAGDRIRIGADETDVTSHSLGQWHADVSDPYRPKRWDHVELLMDVTINPGKRNYPPNTPCEILCTPERKATLLLQQGFPGSVVTSSDVD